MPRRSDGLLWKDGRERVVPIAVLFFLAAAGFIFSALLHVSTFTGSGAARWLHGARIPSILPFGAMIAMMVIFARRKAKGFGGISWRQVFPFGCPLWVLCALIAFGIYLVASIVVLRDLDEGIPGVSSASGTGYVMTRGNEVREIDEERYYRLRDIKFRVTTLAWMALYLLPASSCGVYLSRVKKAAGPESHGLAEREIRK